MTEEKSKKLIVASTVGAVLLAVILLAVLIYQLFAMGAEKRKIAYFEERIAECNRMIEEGENIKMARSERDWIIAEARKYGYILSTDTNID